MDLRLGQSNVGVLAPLGYSDVLLFRQMDGGSDLLYDVARFIADRTVTVTNRPIASVL